ncbi:MFS transporter [Jannaschia pagri]|uniref:MFS transporter n=1 Tax=Jannaschia pagri TaxID=2829797 RepID=A0ABQ4NQ77_9RHOB|nr:MULTISPECIES: MFS transporter [unclassified Jannaschia]GIT92590.1 MFS transporter [Jannaschia sp. AI_61]GIT96550.1 MFS transporter [Jannaschia sp. AI_62]
MRDLTQKRRVRGWMMFDVASQPFYTLCLTFLFGPYLTSTLTEVWQAGGVPEQQSDADAQALWSRLQMMIGLAIAVTAPFLGALADRTGRRRGWILLFSAFYVAGTAGLWLMMPDGSGLTVALIAFAMAMIGAEYTTIYTNAMLPDLVPASQTGRVSGRGYAIGYAGGVLALFIMLLGFADNAEGRTFLEGVPLFGLDGAAREGTRFVGPFSALWFIVFMVPFFLWVKDPAGAVGGASLRQAWLDVRTLVRKVPAQRSLSAWLLSSMFFRDALVALYAFGGTYAALVLDWETTSIGIFGILSAITAGVASYIGANIDARHGPKPAITAMILTLTGVVALLCLMSREAFLFIPLSEGSLVPDVVFYIIGCVIGGAGGVLQAASRTMMVRHADPARPTEAFGLYALSGKATAFLAPALIWIATDLTGSARLGILPVAGLFMLGLLLLVWVKPNGEHTAWSEPSSPV